MDALRLVDSFELLDIDAEKFFGPISQQAGSGASIQYDKIYDDIKEARRGDDSSLPQGVWETPLKKSDWREVIRLCIYGIQEESKDLQLAIWMTEAATNLHGFRGFTEGIQAINLLFQNFEDTLHPQDDEDDNTGRICCIEWFFNKLTTTLSLLPLTKISEITTQTYNFDYWLKSLKAAIPQDNQDDEQQDETSHLTNREKFIEAFKATDSNWRTLNEEAARNSLLLLQNLEEILEELHGDEMPSASSLRNTLTELILIHERYKGVKGMSVKDDQMPDSNAETQENNAINDDPSPTNTKIYHLKAQNGEIKTRTDAYEQLQNIAEFLMKIEPHSPAPYLVMRAVTWGHMSLPELLTELSSEQADIRQLTALLGLTSTEQDYS